MLTTTTIYEFVKEYIKTLLINVFKISNVSHSLEYAIVKNVYFEWVEYGIGIYANEVYKRVEKKISKKQKRKYFYAILDKLAKNNIIVIKKKDGYKFLEVPGGHQQAIFNLIKYMQNSNSKYERFLEGFKAEFSPKPRDIRKLALLEFKDKKLLDMFDREKLKMLFYEYLSGIEDNCIVLYHRKCGKVLLLPYKTRFNSEYRLYEKIEEFYNLFENAKEKYRDAVFLTLTLDPKNFRNIYDASKKVSEALNRFISYLKRKFSRKIEYVNVFEFQKNGLVHLHLVIFGFKWLMSQKKLSEIWEKYSMGKIVYIYRLKLGEDGFKWDKKRPKDTKEDYIDLYLVKYLKKAFYDKSELALYWLTNKRFYTYSRGLKEPVKNEVKVKVGYEYIGIFEKSFLWVFGEEELLELFVEPISKIKNYWCSYGYG